MRRPFRTRVSFPGEFPGFAPWAGMRCPFRAWNSKYDGRAWNSKYDGRAWYSKYDGRAWDREPGAKKRFLIRFLTDVAWGPSMETGVSDPSYRREDTLARAARWDPGGLFLLLSGEVGHEVDKLLFGHGWGEGGHEGGRHFVAAGQV